MTCLQCGGTMTTKRENVPYTALPGAVLVGVEVSRCSNCGEHEVAIPAIDELNRTLALAVIRKSQRLSGAEFRFLRSYLGFSSVDFAELIGADPSSVSRWENGRQPVGRHVDLLLRTMVAHEKRVDEYPIAELGKFGATPATKKTTYAVRPSAKSWKQTEIHA